MSIVLAIIIFCILIFVHELGHLISAKATGVKVNEFALGMGPKIFGFQKGETMYSLRAIPIGGFCSMEGDDEESDDPRAFNKKPAWVKILVFLAGSLMNILLAIVILSMIIFYIGQPLLSIEAVSESAPIGVDGLKIGDEIVEINGEPVSSWDDVPDIIVNVASNSEPLEATEENTGRYGDIILSSAEINFVVDRGGEMVNIDSHLYYDESGNLKIGITPKSGHSFTYFFKSFGYGVQATWDMMKSMYYFIGQLITGQSGLDQLTGPVGVVKVVSESAKAGAIRLFEFTALISLNLGVVNLLPFPALDGGRLLFVLIRKLTGKKITDSIENKFHLVGIMLLFALMIIITIKDVDRLFF